MTGIGLIQIVFYLSIVLVFVKPLGGYIAQVYEGKPTWLSPVLLPLERFMYRICGIRPTQEMEWKTYLYTMLLFNLFGCLAVYGLERYQAYLLLNPQAFTGVPPDLAFNTAASFVTNTNWQAYSGEQTMSYLTQMLGLTVQNFLSAATGMSLLIALIRGFARSETRQLGNFWVDTIRGILYIFMPLAFVLALILSSQGVIQNLKAYQQISLIQPLHDQDQTITEVLLPMGPAASQIAIKQLGTNGGGFFNVNAAHPFENPTPLTNFLEMLAILLIPAALCYTFGMMVKDKRQGWTLLLVMFLIYVPCMCFTVISEQTGNPAFYTMGIDMVPYKNSYSGGNMEGKETRFGIINSALWASATTTTSNGSVNAMHDSFTPLGGLMLLWLMHLGEVVFGGVGSGLYGMLMLVIISVFIAGLMIGRTPEYLCKKIEPFEMKMASVAVLLMPIFVLVLTAAAVILPAGQSAVANPGPHGLSEILYAFTSMGNNNGSAFAGLNANTAFYNIIGGLEMLFLRYWLAIPALAIAGSMARKKLIPTSSGTLQTYTPIFIILLIFVTIIIGALTFFPVLALGPIVEHLMLWKQYAH